MSASLDLRWEPSERVMYQRPGNRNWHFLDPRNAQETPLITNDSVGWIFVPPSIQQPVAPDGQSVIMMWQRRSVPIDEQVGLWRISLVDSSQTFLWPSETHRMAYWAEDSQSVWWHDYETNQLRRRTFDGVYHESVDYPDECANIGDFTPDRSRLVCAEAESSRDVWLVEGFDPAGGR